jgi:hypothetical protein
MKFNGCICHALPIICGFLVSIVHALAQSDEPVALENFSERLSKDVPVSGRMLVGVVVKPNANKKSAKPPTPRLLWREKGESADEPLCVTIVSGDGQYYGEGRLGAETLQTLRRPRPVKGTHRENAENYLREKSSDELAMLAISGECGLSTAVRTTPTVHVLDNRDLGVSTEKSVVGPDFTLQLFLNSLNYTLEVKLVFPSKLTKTATCFALDEFRRNKAFNTRCEIEVLNEETEADLVINRRKYERIFDPIRFKLAWSRL